MQKLIHHWLQADKFFKTLAFYATLVVVIFSLKPNLLIKQPWSFTFIREDHLLHFICYFGMTSLYFFAFYTKQNALKKSLIYSLALGGILELLQLFPVFQRHFDYTDLLANSLGMVSAWLIIKGFFNYSVKE